MTAELHKLNSGETQRRLSGGIMFGQYMHELFVSDRRGLKGKMLSPRTCQVDLDLVYRYILRRTPALAATPLARLSTEALARAFRQLAEGSDQHWPLARATARRVYEILRARPAHAVKLQHLRANPVRADFIPVDGKAPRQHRTLQPEQEQTLLAEAPANRYGALIATLTWTGARPGEGAGLTWPDMDHEGAALVIRRALVRTKGKWDLRSTKTGTVRRVPIPAALVQLL